MIHVLKKKISIHKYLNAVMANVTATNKLIIRNVMTNVL